MLTHSVSRLFSTTPFGGAVLFFVLLICGLTPASGLTSDTDILGIDVSHHQGAVDWNSVHGHGVEFVYLKATEGRGYVDPWYQSHREALEALPLQVGAYHYFHADHDPEKQARNFIRVVKSGPALDLPPAVDVEEAFGRSAEELVDKLLNWITLVETELGATPIIYTVTGFADRGDQAQDTTRDKARGLSRYPLWYAKYDTDWLKLPPVLGHFQWHIWQFGQGTVPGIDTIVDLNTLNCEALDHEICTRER